MSAIRTEAIVLQNRNFSETSLIATLLSRDHGRLDILAKGARRDKSPLFGHLDLYSREEVLVLPRPSASLDLLTEAAFVDEHAGLRFYPLAFAGAGFLADFAAAAILPGEPLPALFQSLADAFSMLSKLGDPGSRAGVAKHSGFDSGDKETLALRTLTLSTLDILSCLGFGLELGRCVGCGGTIEEGGRVALSRRLGGLVCGKCRAGTGSLFPLSKAGYASLVTRDGTARDRPSRSEAVRILRFLIDYSQHMLEKPLRGKAALLQLLESKLRRPAAKGGRDRITRKG
ncbi:MAG: recombination protein O N-terminal domain-containing protein [Planctomycetes bacterium]|nr:recombination protein O N-terminal domain-containing protein [Planctomycetota bacterium]